MEKYGLFDLEAAIYENCSPEYIDLSIRDFRKLCIQYSKPWRSFFRTGLNYNFLSDFKFLVLTEEFLSSIISYEFPLEWHMIQFRHPHISLLFRKFVRLLSYKLYQKFVPRASFVDLDRDQFYSSARSYILSFIGAAASMKCSSSPLYYALHNCINPYNTLSYERLCRFLPNSKYILVDRNPLDVYLSTPLYRYLPFYSRDPHHIANSFINFYTKSRLSLPLLKSIPNFMLVRFESLVEDYANSTSSIFDFLGISPSRHSLKNSFFKPSSSISNISMHARNSYNPFDCEVIDIIASHPCFLNYNN